VNATEVLALAKQLADAVGEEPGDDVYDACSTGFDRARGLPLTPEQERADAILEEWHTLERNAERFLCDAVDWNVPLLESVTATNPYSDDDPWPGEWSIVFGAKHAARFATSDPLERRGVGPGRINYSPAESLVDTFVTLFHRIVGGPNETVYRACDKEAALSMWDELAPKVTRDVVWDRTITDDDRERGRVDLALWEPYGPDKRHLARR
jgi:hypothetical protein